MEMVKSLNCTWTSIQAISEAAICPSCGSACVIVFAEEEEQRIADFEAGHYQWIDYNLKDHEPPGWQPRPHPGYSAMLAWAREQPRCFKHVMHLYNSYKKYTGNVVDMTL